MNGRRRAFVEIIIFGYCGIGNCAVPLHRQNFIKMKTTGIIRYGTALAIGFCMFLPSMAQQAEYGEYEKFRVGGYGEMAGNLKNYQDDRFSGITTGSSNGNRATISIPRFVLALDYKFNPKWVLGAEVEFESGGVGMETELENSENGEYELEMEKGGEVALEQFHVTRLIGRGFNIRAGHMILPIGLTNSHHEPILFFGPERPEDETTILPSTWHETGVGIFGDLGRDKMNFQYQVMAVAGLNPDGFGRDHWVADGKQGLFEADKFSSPAYVGRLDYTGVKGLRLGASAYYCANTGKNADKPHKYAKCGNTGLYLLSADAQYRNALITARANVIYGHLNNSDKISNVILSNKSNYHSGSMRKVAGTALTYGAEVGMNLKALTGLAKCPTTYPYIRYEYFSPQHKAAEGVSIDERCHVSKWQAGLNYFALPNLVIKAAYSNRRIGTRRVFGYGKPYNRENEFSIGVAYTAWFWKK